MSKRAEIWRSPSCSRIRADSLCDCKVSESSTSTIHIITHSYVHPSLPASLTTRGAVNPALDKPVHHTRPWHRQPPCRMRSVVWMRRTSRLERTKTSSPTTRKLRRGLVSMVQHTRIKVPTRRGHSSSSRIYASFRFALYVLLSW
jgi:hypothetical protein